MKGTDVKEMQMGYLYYSLYSYKRKIEGDIKNLIRLDSQIGDVSFRMGNNKSKEALCHLTQRLRNISMILSRLVSLNKVDKIK